MSKYVETTHPQKTVGAYLKAVKALEELQQLGEDVSFHYARTELTGTTGSIVWDDGRWSFVQS